MGTRVSRGCPVRGPGTQMEEGAATREALSATAEFRGAHYAWRVSPLQLQEISERGHRRTTWDVKKEELCTKRD